MTMKKIAIFNFCDYMFDDLKEKFDVIGETLTSRADKYDWATIGYIPEVAEKLKDIEVWVDGDTELLYLKGDFNLLEAELPDFKNERYLGIGSYRAYDLESIYLGSILQVLYSSDEYE